MKNKIDLQRIYAVTVLTMLLCFGMAYARADTPPKPPDQLMCEALFKDHVLGGFKMPERDNRAALQVLADTARRNGFWHIVLSEIEKEDSKPSPKRACAIVLGKVLQEDGWTRDVLKRQKEPAQIPYEVFLSDSEKGKIVDALLSCLLQTSHE